MKARPRLTLGTTPCPNDSHLLGAVATGQLGIPGLDLEIRRADIETLNEAVLARELDVAKISCAIFEQVADAYVLLDTGAALADGYGPLVLSRGDRAAPTLSGARVAMPGPNTTAALLFRHWTQAAVTTVHLPYHRIVDALLAGECDLGVVIHESRFTYADSGLRCLEDLGRWWQATRGLPVPLGCYVMRRSLHRRYGAALERVMCRALHLADSGNAAIAAHVHEHAQEPDAEVTRRHIALYVNAYTRSLGVRGREAIAALGAGRLQTGT